jgi:hypothetical protein
MSRVLKMVLKGCVGNGTYIHQMQLPAIAYVPENRPETTFQYLIGYSCHRQSEWIIVVFFQQHSCGASLFGGNILAFFWIRNSGFYLFSIFIIPCPNDSFFLLI